MRREFITALTPFQYSIHLKRMNCASSWQRGFTGRAVRIAMLDSGVKADHLFLQSLSLHRASALDGINGDDENGHGTLTAGLIVGHDGSRAIGVAPRAELVSLRVIDAAGQVPPGAYKRALALAHPFRPHVVCVSIAHDDLHGDDAHAFSAFAAETGALIVAAAGNSHEVGRMVPAGLPGVCGVAALTLAGDWLYTLPTSCEWIRWASFGERLCSAALGGGVTRHHGTSAATAVVAGTAALVLSVAPDEVSRRSLLTQLPAILGAAATHGYPSRVDDVDAAVTRALSLLAVS